MTSAADVTAALDAIWAGSRADELETDQLEFKEQIGRSRDDTLKMVAEAAVCFANAGGGTLVVGVADAIPGTGAFVGASLDPRDVRQRVYGMTNPSLDVQAASHDFRGVELLIVKVSEGLEIYTGPRGRATRRVGNACEPIDAQEIVLLSEERRGIDWSAQPSERQVQDADSAALDEARRLLGRLPDLRREMARLGPRDLLRDLRVLDNRGRLLRAGEILFCPPQERPLVRYEFAHTPSGEPSQRFDEALPLLLAFKRITEMFDLHGSVVPIHVKGQEISLRDFPELAVREAVVNGLVHRSYRESDPVAINHSSEVLSVVSPGPLVSGITKDNILTHPPRARNPLLAGVVRQLGLAEESGRGVDRMFREMIRSGKTPPEYTPSSHSVRVEMVGGAPNKHVASYIASLPEREQDDVDVMLTIFHLTQHERVTAGAFASTLQRGSEATEAVLRRLDAQGVLEPTRGTVRLKHPNYKLSSAALTALGPSLSYRRQALDQIREKIIRIVRKQGTIQAGAVQVAFDLNPSQASYRLRSLCEEGILVKLGDRERGRGIEYGPGPSFPRSRSVG